jgi:hypothetical protein
MTGNRLSRCKGDETDILIGDLYKDSSLIVFQPILIGTEYVCRVGAERSSLGHDNVL